MNSLVTHIVESPLEDEKIEQTKEIEEPGVAKERKIIGHALNSYHYIFNANNEDAK